MPHDSTSHFASGSWVMGRSDAHVSAINSSLQNVHSCNTGNMVYHVMHFT